MNYVSDKLAELFSFIEDVFAGIIISGEYIWEFSSDSHFCMKLVFIMGGSRGGDRVP